MIHRNNLTTILIAAATIALSACSKHHQLESDLASYTQRLEDFTDLQSHSTDFIKPISLAPLPSKSELVYSIAPTNINLREFNAFNACTLNTLIAERNTALGKMQLPSSRFIYENQLLIEFDKCLEFLNNTQADKELINKLEELKSIKLAQYSKVWSNFITQSNEITRQICGASDYITASSSDNFFATKQAFTYLAKTYHRNSTPHISVSSKELERHMQTLEQSRLLGRIFKSQIVITQYLNANSSILEKYLDINKCENVTQENDIAIMRNIFTLFFAQKIQAVAGELNKYMYHLRPIVLSLVEHTNLPPAYSAYLHHNLEVEHSKYKASMQKHISLWQKIFARCDAR